MSWFLQLDLPCSQLDPEKLRCELRVPLEPPGGAAAPLVLGRLNLYECVTMSRSALSFQAQEDGVLVSILGQTPTFFTRPGEPEQRLLKGESALCRAGTSFRLVVGAAPTVEVLALCLRSEALPSSPPF